eukprot:3230865-Rhodomonas_salina.2
MVSEGNDIYRVSWRLAKSTGIYNAVAARGARSKLSARNMNNRRPWSGRTTRVVMDNPYLQTLAWMRWESSSPVCGMYRLVNAGCSVVV